MFDLMKIGAFSTEMGVSENTIYSWKRRGDIPPSCFKKIGGTVFIRISEMKKWLDNSENDATTVL